MDEDLEPLLDRYKQGETAALDEMFLRLAPNLKVLARYYLRGQSFGVTQQSTALLHDLFVHLRGRLENRALDLNSVDHLLSRLAMEMQNMIKDQARAARTQKRGGAALRHSLSDGDVADDAFVRFEKLNSALDALRAEDRRAYVAFVHRVQMGLSAEETAHLLGISSATLSRETHFAKSFLKLHIGWAEAGAPRDFIPNRSSNH